MITTNKEIVEENAAVRAAFAMNFRLPEWSNSVCYALEMPPGTERLVSSNEIRTAFGLTKAEYDLLHDFGTKPRNRKRLLDGLVRKQAIKYVDGEIMTNPAIRLAQGWWTPYMYGVMCVDWENEHWTTCTTSHKSDWDARFMDLGASFAAASHNSAAQALSEASEEAIQSYCPDQKRSGVAPSEAHRPNPRPLPHPDALPDREFDDFLDSAGLNVQS